MSELTDRENDVFCFIKKFKDEHGYSPTWKEIGVGVHLESKTGLQHYLMDLCEKGYIRLTPRTPRSIVMNIKM